MIDYENLALLNSPFMAELEKRAAEVLRSGWYILGKQVGEFEKEFAAYCVAPHCVGVASGLDALLLCLEVLDLPSGSEVIVPSNTYIATILAILRAGHKPVLVEPDPKTYNIDPARIEAAITGQTKAVLVVHLYGKPCDMDPILDACHRHDLRLVEDCAQSHGGRYNGKMTGTFGLGAFSFYPTKNLGAFGDAGAIVCQDAGTAEKLRTLRNYGSQKKYYNEVLGHNSRLDELQAVFLRVKLPALEKINAHKRELAEIYHEALSDQVVKPHRDPRLVEANHIFSVRTPKRDALREHLLKKGIKTEIHYPVSPNKQVAMRGILDRLSCPVSEEIHGTTLSLPISFFHTKADVLNVAKAVNEFFSA